MSFVIKTFRYKLYPTRKQSELLNSYLEEACRLYNAALQERRDAWRLCKESISYCAQVRQLKEIRASGDIGLPNFSAANQVLRRLDTAFRSFFLRSKNRVVGFPRFKPINKFKSITFPIYGNGCKVIESKLRLQGVGLIKIKLHRLIDGKIKTVTVKREAGLWYVCFATECAPRPLPESFEAVGVDVGLTHFATLSDGTQIPNSRYYCNAQRKLRVSQRRASRRKSGSRRRRKAIQTLQRTHQYIRDQRHDFQHKVSCYLVKRFGLIAVEALNIEGLANGLLAKSVRDAGWGSFLDKLAYKAENAGREFFRVNPNGTTQNCSGCGSLVVKALWERTHSCSCGLLLDRDHNAAINILRLGLSLKDLTCPAGESVSLEAV